VKPFLRIAISLLLTAAFLILFWRSFDLMAARRSLAAASPALIALSVVVNLGGYLLRAWRWRFLLQPLRRGLGMYNLTSTTFIGFMVSFLVPFRVGEVVRPVLLARRERLSASAAIATIALERLLDVVTVMGLFLAFVLSTRGAALIAAPGADGAMSQATLFLRRGVGVSAGFVALGLPLAILLVAFPTQVVALLGRLDPAGRSALLRRITGVVETFASGLRVLRRGRELFACLVLSVAMWLTIDLSVYLTARAFGLPLVFSDTFLLLVPLAVGIAVPTPGGVGPYEYLGQISLTDFWGIAPASAAATAVVLHVIALVPTIVIGLLFMWRDGLRLADVRAATAADPIRETPS
jgi:glycosyltransferase 2 family protein